MSTQSRGLIIPFVAAALVEANRIVKFGATDGEVEHAAAATDVALGVTTFIQNAAGEVTDVQIEGTAQVKAGGTIAQGDALTSDANGQAVVAAATQPFIGIALEPGVSGDLINVAIRPGYLPA